MSAQPAECLTEYRTRYFIYTRISRDAEGKELGVGRQNEDLEALVERNGGVIVGRYKDNDLSASRFATKPRPEFEAMVKAAAANGCDVIAAYTTGRITRHPGEFQRLIELAERHGIRFEYVNSPNFDLSTADGRMVARVMSSTDAAEADRISERVRRARQQRRDSGLIDPPASRCFGWETGGYTVVNLAEASHVKAVFRLVAGGKGAPEVADYLVKHGVTGTDGSVKWQARKVHNILRRATYCGLLKNSAGELIRGENITVIVSEDLWREAQAVLDERKMATRRPSRKRLLSGMVQCGECGSRMLPKSGRKNKRGYLQPEAWYCKKEIGSTACGSVSRVMTIIDAMVDAFVMARIESAAAVTAAPAPSADAEADAAELARLNASLTDTRELIVSGALTPQDGAAVLGGIRDRIGALEGAQSRARAQVARARATSSLDAATVWRDRSPEAESARRMILEQYVSRIVVGKFDKGNGAGRRAASINSVTVIPA